MIYAVFVGGGLGALLRYMLSVIFSRFNFAFPCHTLFGNFLGCFIAGIVISLITAKNGINPLYKAFIITGFCGGLTTFSTFSLETVEYFQTGEYIKGLLYILASLLVCILSVFLGIVSVKKFIS